MSQLTHSFIEAYDKETEVEYQKLLTASEQIIDMDHPDFFQASSYTVRREVDKEILIDLITLANKENTRVQS
jgi:hypothetical protein